MRPPSANRKYPVKGHFNLPALDLNEAPLKQSVLNFTRNRQLDEWTVFWSAPEKAHQPERFLIRKVMSARHAKAPPGRIRRAILQDYPKQ